MQLSTRARYGLRFMLQLARGAPGGGNQSIGQIAKRTLLPRRYLEQLAVGLKNASLIKATTGRDGGYRLAKPPEDISIRAIVEASIGPINIVGCIGEPDTCMWVDSCECRLLYRLINSRITDTLDEFSLADMAGADWGKKVARGSEEGRALPVLGNAPEIPRS